jgi:hypothetical protein
VPLLVSQQPRPGGEESRVVVGEHDVADGEGRRAGQPQSRSGGQQRAAVGHRDAGAGAGGEREPEQRGAVQGVEGLPDPPGLHAPSVPGREARR